MDCAEVRRLMDTPIDEFETVMTGEVTGAIVTHMETCAGCRARNDAMNRLFNPLLSAVAPPMKKELRHVFSGMKGSSEQAVADALVKDARAT